MSRRKLAGLIALAALALAGLAARWATGVHQDDWPLLMKMLFVMAFCAGIFAAFYDRKNFPEKTWDYNPRRGLLFFCLGWVLFPAMFAINASLGTEIAWATMLTGTAIMSVFIGIVGTFTENVGV